MFSRRQFLERFVLGGSAALTFLKVDALAKLSDALSQVGPDIKPHDLASQEWFWSRVQSAFELDRSIIHLNSGGVSASPSVVHNQTVSHLDPNKSFLTF